MKYNILDNLRRSLLWDVEDKKLDFEKDAQFVIGRVLDFANLREWKIIEKFYGIEKIKKAAQNHIFLIGVVPIFGQWY
ncbi:MAG TPA: hypothetical protein PLB98_04265 [bacterium]|nr:hypothetical protein [bacterium]